MKDFAFKNKKQIFIIIFAIKLLIFFPLYFSVNNFLLSSADEIINSWYQSEKTSIQQGNILSSISKLQRPIKNSTLLKGIIVKNDDGHELLKIGKTFIIDDKIHQSIQSPKYIRAGFSSYIYKLNENGLSIYIFISSFLPYIVAIGFAIYLTVIFFILAYFLRREAVLLEKMKNEHELESMKIKIEMDKKLLIMSQQVAHDIQSPLAALNIVSSQIKQHSAEIGELNNILNISINRINEIASDLLKNEKRKDEKFEFKITSLEKTISDIIAEKNVILINKNMHPIIFHEKYFKNVFVNICTKEFSRLLSNILNNSIDAIESKKGIIDISGIYDNGQFIIMINDNGKGIPPSVLSKLGELGVSFGKNNGNGLGLFHARKTIESFGGDLKIESDENIGTKISLKLPCINNQTENKQNHQQIILFEDDELVKIIWKFNAKKIGINLSVFSNYEEFLTIHNTCPFSLSIPIYSDVNLSQTESGLDIVKNLNKLGFDNINLCTGYKPEDLDVPVFIKSVTDKNFPHLEPAFPFSTP